MSDLHTVQTGQPLPTGYQRRYNTRDGSQEPVFVIVAYVFNVYMCACVHIH